MPLWPLFYNIAHYLNWKIQILETYGIQTEQNGTAYFAMLSFVAPLYEAQELSFNIYLRHTLATCQLPSEQKEIHNKYITISSVFYPQVKQSKRLLWYYYMTSNTHTHTLNTLIAKKSTIEDMNQINIHLLQSIGLLWYEISIPEIETFSCKMFICN